MSSRTPRVVVVTRPTELERVLARHGTYAQAAFYMRTYGQDIEVVRARHERFEAALASVLSQVPVSWRRARVARAQLDRFLFAPEDLVVAVGQDGLVANVAKYVCEQPVIGINPDPDEYAGVLARHAPARLKRLLLGAAKGRCAIERRPMVEARTGVGHALRALNEVFVGHRTHQSARYRIACGGRAERQISSGLIVSTGTGATGWARSILAQRRAAPPAPGPEEDRLIYLVREAYASPSSGTEVTAGAIGPGDELELVSEMNDGGVLFGDGIEEDRVELPYGMTLTVRLAPDALRLVV
jgi:NAD kinase